MKEKRTLIYVNANLQNHEFIYTGIEFYEFLGCLKKPMKNILLLKANYMGNKLVKNFELVDGREEVDLLSKEDINNYGDFCFVDYSQSEKVNTLTDEQVSEVLYMAHMYKPLKSPFFDGLDNRFAYLAHDDGFSCKLYCREPEDFLNVLNGKIISLIEIMTKSQINNLDIGTLKTLLKFAEEGLLFDFEETKINNNQISTKIYAVGKYTDMDKILNERKTIKENAIRQKHLIYQQNKWEFADVDLGEYDFDN